MNQLVPFLNRESLRRERNRKIKPHVSTKRTRLAFTRRTPGALEDRSSRFADLFRSGNLMELRGGRHHRSALAVGAATIGRGSVAIARLSISRSKPSLRMRIS